MLYLIGLTSPIGWESVVVRNGGQLNGRKMTRLIRQAQMPKIAASKTTTRTTIVVRELFLNLIQLLSPTIYYSTVVIESNFLFYERLATRLHYKLLNRGF